MTTDSWKKKEGQKRKWKKELVCQAKDRSEKEKEDLGAKANYGEPIQRLWDITPVKNNGKQTIHRRHATREHR